MCGFCFDQFAHILCTSLKTDTELSREVEQNIEQADGSAYMAIFVTTSTSYTPPEKYFNDAKIEIERCRKNMDELAAMINIKF